MKSHPRSMRLRNAFSKTTPGGSLWLVKWLLLVVLIALVLLAVMFQVGNRSADGKAATAWRYSISASQCSLRQICTPRVAV